MGAEEGMEEIERVGTDDEDEEAEVEEEVTEDIPRKDVMEFSGSSDEKQLLVAASGEGGGTSSAGQVYNIGITSQQMEGGISSAAQVNCYGNTTQQGGGISFAAQVNSNANTTQQVGGGIISVAQGNSYGNMKQQVVQIPHLPLIGGLFNSAARANSNGNSAQKVNVVKDAKSKLKYNGSHRELAARLQKEILDRNTGVKCDDVAELSEATPTVDARVFPGIEDG
ncbi:hypothetical protein RDI58_017644 [Solanum bulbocastanum]|uniref:Uncharacterized protein n=1 Tax=Solanum bulbocastanum TaxID=147425 RepID=A0AAN8T9W4_SOLBU